MGLYYHDFLCQLCWLAGGLLFTHIIFPLQPFLPGKASPEEAPVGSPWELAFRQLKQQQAGMVLFESSSKMCTWLSLPTLLTGWWIAFYTHHISSLAFSSRKSLSWGSASGLTMRTSVRALAIKTTIRHGNVESSSTWLYDVWWLIENDSQVLQQMFYFKAFS